jgi:uncharacterized membrane protein
MDERANSPVLLDAVLRPSPPLPPNALLLILAIVAALNLAFGMAFLLRGAWPVTPFMGADVLLLSWAFRASRLAAEREEHLTLTPTLLTVTNRPVHKSKPDVTLNPYWIRVEVAEVPGRASQLTLWSHGQGVRIGAFLAPEARASFAARLSEALRQAKNIRA